MVNSPRKYLVVKATTTRGGASSRFFVMILVLKMNTLYRYSTVSSRRGVSNLTYAYVRPTLILKRNGHVVESQGPTTMRTRQIRSRIYSTTQEDTEGSTTVAMTPSTDDTTIVSTTASPVVPNENFQFDMDDIISLCKRRGLIFPSSEIYNGYAGFYDYGPIGVELKRSVKDLWWKTFVTSREDVVGLDSSIIHNPTTWKSSGMSY
jgi:hypothetical protein